MLIEKSGDALGIARICGRGGGNEEFWGGEGFKGLGEGEVFMKEQVDGEEAGARIAAGGGEKVGVGTIENECGNGSVGCGQMDCERGSDAAAVGDNLRCGNTS